MRHADRVLLFGAAAILFVILWALVVIGYWNSVANPTVLTAAILCLAMTEIILVAAWLTGPAGQHKNNQSSLKG